VFRDIDAMKLHHVLRQINAYTDNPVHDVLLARLIGPAPPSWHIPTLA
jgi:hypothetical protein